MKRIRILQLIDHLGTGGAQELLLSIAQRIDRNLIEMEVCTLHGWGAYAMELEALGFPVHSLAQHRLDPRIPFRLLALLRRQRYQLLHLHLEASSLLGAVLGHYAHIPCTVITVHSLRNQMSFWFLPILKFISPLVESYVAEARLSWRELLEAGIPMPKLRYIPLGSAPFLGQEEGVAGIRAELSPEEEGPILLNIARLHPQKGQSYLLRAMVRVLQRVPSARLLIVGDGPLRQQLERMVEELGLEGSVLFTGFRRDLARLYASCDLLVIPSVQEGLGMATLQAMAAGRPVVATSVGALSEAVVTGLTGLLVPPADPQALAEAILQLLEEPDLRERMGKQARAFAAQYFPVEAMVRGYERLYASALQPNLEAKTYVNLVSPH